MSASLKYDKYLRTDCWWMQTRQAALDRAGHRCEARVIDKRGVAVRCCNPATEVHHKNGYACVGIEQPKDLLSLCRTHHSAMHGLLSPNLKRLKLPKPANDNQLPLPMDLPLLVKGHSS